ncbi:hypothetical protein KUTeg_023424 [Tegillarca granosa]|uniref:Uncharacterized protein n=1 Tax=Tegillarca granosa TaxID=220873 RepID=A0ABQ9E200_TEGGR|nr:hypothetical protein KUTeg_023424 [Tegillarca granosa]
MESVIMDVLIEQDNSKVKEEPPCLPATEENDALVVEEMDRVIALMEKTQKDFYGPLLPMWDDQNGILQRQQKYHEQFLAKQEIFGIGARFEFWFFGYFRFLNPELKVATGIMDRCLLKDPDKVEEIQWKMK